MTVREDRSAKHKTSHRKHDASGTRGTFCGRKCTLVVFLFLLFVSVSTTVFSDDMPLRCPNGSLVQIGDDEGTVRRKCGEPYEVRRTNPKSQTIRGHEVKLSPIMQWSYNMGSADYIYILTFKEGKVTDITTGGRGFAK